jgi:hypothetical protein
MRSSARRRTWRESAAYGSPSGVRMSHTMRATDRSPACHGIVRYVVGSGSATMSDSSIALNPVTDEPSKPMPRSSVPGSSSRVMAKLFRRPTTSVNHSRMNLTSSSATRRSTSSRASVPVRLASIGPIDPSLCR